MLTESGDIQHHSHVKRIGALLYDQTKHKARKHFCSLCLSSFTMKENLKRHEEVSIGINCRPTKAEMPKQEKNLISFQNYNKQLKAPYVTYADVEAIVEKCSGVNKISKRVTQKKRATTLHVDMRTKW